MQRIIPETHSKPTLKVITFLACLVIISSVEVADAKEHTLLLEAENFADPGGWVVDQQFMDQMGSPYLLAHGLGVPVSDATTSVAIPAAATYQVWVRTKDWVARWKAPGAPGKFQVQFDGKLIPTVFGTQGSQWHWHKGEAIPLKQKTVKVTLHDLTGFEGRCDAILLTTDQKSIPPHNPSELTKWRRTILGQKAIPREAGKYDLVVVGGGIAGTCAALSAARLGLQVALVQDRPVLGGNNSSEVRVWLHGKINQEPYPRIGDMVKELEQKKRAHYGPENVAENYEDENKITIVRREKNIALFLKHRANDVTMKANQITAVFAQHIRTSQRIRLQAKWVADCTGDGVIGALAGADYELTPTGRLGACNLWNVIDTGSMISFPCCPWALDLAAKPFPGRDGNGTASLNKLGGWYWESGFDRHPIMEKESIRDWNFRAMYGAWDALKNVDKKYPNHKLNWSAYIMGPRESRRLLGDIILTKEDLMTSKVYPDGCVPTSWTIDLHYPDPRYVKGFAGDAFIAKAEHTQYTRPYWVPYRCLYSRNITNLFMAGRDISVTHEALGTVRVMRTCGMMGEIVGMAASICKRNSVTPRGVYEHYLSELQILMRQGIGKSR